MNEIMNGTIHMCPPEDVAVTPCCGLMVFELPRDDRVTFDPELVSCWFLDEAE